MAEVLDDLENRFDIIVSSAMRSASYNRSFKFDVLAQKLAKRVPFPDVPDDIDLPEIDVVTAVEDLNNKLDDAIVEHLRKATKPVQSFFNQLELLNDDAEFLTKVREIRRKAVKNVDDAFNLKKDYKSSKLKRCILPEAHHSVDIDIKSLVDNIEKEASEKIDSYKKNGQAQKHQSLPSDGDYEFDDVGGISGLEDGQVEEPIAKPATPAVAHTDKDVDKKESDHSSEKQYSEDKKNGEAKSKKRKHSSKSKSSSKTKQSKSDSSMPDCGCLLHDSHVYLIGECDHIDGLKQLLGSHNATIVDFGEDELMMMVSSSLIQKFVFVVIQGNESELVKFDLAKLCPNIKVDFVTLVIPELAGPDFSLDQFHRMKHDSVSVILGTNFDNYDFLKNLFGVCQSPEQRGRIKVVMHDASFKSIEQSEKELADDVRRMEQFGYCQVLVEHDCDANIDCLIKLAENRHSIHRHVVVIAPALTSERLRRVAVECTPDPESIQDLIQSLC